jgi:transposase InsO family protein
VSAERRAWRDGVYAVIQTMTASTPQGETRIERACRLSGVSRAGYYRHWQASAPRREETGLRDAIQRLALTHKHYGYRRIAAQLGREGWHANHKRVLRLMREDNLLCMRRAGFVPKTTDSKHGWRIVPNLARGLELAGLDQLWVADITYVHLAEEFGYLAIVLDAFTRKVVGWAFETHLRAELATAALEMAIAARNPRPGSLIHHSDRGVQYACGDYAAILARHDIQPSMSRVGNPYDNAKAESFMKTLKQEEVYDCDYRDVAQARAHIGSFIETVYNRQRLHSALNYLSPEEYELSTPKLRRVVPPAANTTIETCP